MSNPIPARHIVAKELGRRVSKGEYERMFSQLRPKQLPTVKEGISRETGKPIIYHPVVASRVPESPKAQRKKASANG